jgi:hypothetical protein
MEVDSETMLRLGEELEEEEEETKTSSMYFAQLEGVFSKN